MMTQTLSIHVLKNHDTISRLFPLNLAMVRVIADSMGERGYDEAFPVIIWKGKGCVVDGYTRRAAAARAGIEDIPYVEREFANENEALDYAINCQKNRRNLTDAELVRCLSELDKRRSPQESGAEGGRSKGAPSGVALKPSSHDTAEKLGISPRKVERLRTVMDHADDDVKEALEAGEISGNKAYTITQERRKAETAEAEAADDVPEDSAVRAIRYLVKRIDQRSRLLAMRAEIDQRLTELEG